MGWVKYVACIQESINAFKICIREHKGKRPFGRPWHRLKKN
jgi:hypothetical protein